LVKIVGKQLETFAHLSDELCYNISIVICAIREGKGYVMDDKKLTNQIADTHSCIFAGPIDIDLCDRVVCTATGEVLSLEPQEFDALVLLAQHEGEFVTLESLCGVTSCDADKTRAVLQNLTSKVDEIKGKFVWIEHLDEGYLYKTRWGRDAWRDTEADITADVTAIQISVEKHPKLKPLHKRAFAAMGVAAAAMLAVIITTFGGVPRDILDLTDDGVPMAQPGDLDCVHPSGCEDEDEESVDVD